MTNQNKSKCVCQRCRHAFVSTSTALTECPRCHSSNVICKALTPGEAAATEAAQSHKESLTTGKQSWRDFHSSGTSQKCPKCGSTRFKLDYKHKERICINCGELLPLPRRGA